MEQPSFMSSCGSSYDVFLSFRGEDVRKNFVDHLYSAMQQKGIYTFKDDEELERGKSISPALEKAIDESSMAVVVFSEHYADSTWCLEELVKIMECMEMKGQMVVPIFYGVDPSTVRKQKGKYGETFEGYEKRFEKEGEKVKKWRKVLEDVSNLAGWDLENTENGLELASNPISSQIPPPPSQIHKIRRFYMLELVFHRRMLEYPCLTSDHAHAAAVYLPYYAGLDSLRYLFGRETNSFFCLGLNLYDYIARVD